MVIDVLKKTRDAVGGSEIYVKTTSSINVNSRLLTFIETFAPMGRVQRDLTWPKLKSVIIGMSKPLTKSLITCERVRLFSPCASQPFILPKTMPRKPLKFLHILRCVNIRSILYGGSLISSTKRILLVKLKSYFVPINACKRQRLPPINVP